MRAFYFGNSLTGVSNPDWHEDLGQSAGKQWQNAAWLGAGWQLWQHREQFNYEARWQQKYDPKTEKPWISHVNRTQDFSYQVFRGLQERFPELSRAGRLRMIPAGDLFLELDKRMLAGQVPGCRDIRDFYTDVQHIRFGLPRYTAAAMFYACLFAEPPDKLDWKIYNDRAKYGDDPHHDGGELLPITPENVKAVNNTIWRVLNNHPFTGLKENQ